MNRCDSEAFVMWQAPRRQSSEVPRRSAMTDKRAGEEMTSPTRVGERRDLKSIRELGYAHIRVAGYALGENPRYRREFGGI